MAYQMLVGSLDAAPGPRAKQVLGKTEVPESLAELIVNCTSEDLADRPATAGELVKKLRELRDEEHTEYRADLGRFGRCETSEERAAFLQEARPLDSIVG